MKMIIHMCVYVQSYDAAVAVKSAPHVSHASRVSQKMERQTEHTKPDAMGRLWQKHEARKSTPRVAGSLRNLRLCKSTLAVERRY
jgi:hypothetical protein